MTTRMLCLSVTILTRSKRETRKHKQSNAPDQINRIRYEIAARFRSPFVFRGRLGRSTQVRIKKAKIEKLAPGRRA